MTSVQVRSAVAEALSQGRPVVALESALITHGFPAPANLEIALRMEAAVREEGAVPATIAVIAGQPIVGLSEEELRRLARAAEDDQDSENAPRKISLRDLPIAVAQGLSGGTTVSATMHVAHLTGIEILATGGIGGVHRRHPEDVSADLTALGSIPITVVCAGAKALLDLPRTLEVLETQGVAVIGYGTEAFPAFYSRRSGFGTDGSVTAPEGVAALAKARDSLGLRAALLVCVPVPKEAAVPRSTAEEAIARAMEEAEVAGVSGREVTPFLLDRIVAHTEGRARRANEALLTNNAGVAARIAGAMVSGEGEA